MSSPIYSEQLLDREPSTVNKYSAFKKSSKTGRTAQRSLKRGRSHSRQREEVPLLVHSHLCWDWVWQRPQQFVSRLSARHPVLFIETAAPDPELAAPLARFRQLADFPNITVLRLQFPAWCWHDGERIDRERRRLVQQFLQGPMAGQFDRPVQWFYDPMTVPAFAGQMNEILTVYDCMDELSKFAAAPPQMLAREFELLSRADLVFTGGYKLYQSKRRFNDNCHFYGCGVDYDHFGKARAAQTAVPPELAALPRPVFGYFGVVDERLDYELLASLAEANPEGSVALVGPVLKVEARALPRRPNLHWLGQRAYNDLPALCKGFDVCLMPFALNEATEFINPTKALEYMATGRITVSSAVPDVVHNFSSVVKVAASPQEFITLCREAVQAPDHAAIARGLELARANSWDSVVASLERHLAETLENKLITREVA